MAARDDHDYRTCGDRDCERFPCRVFKEGWRDGFDDGHDDGWTEGWAVGYAEGFAAAQSSCSCG
jgi:hypothetical protein